MVNVLPLPARATTTSTWRPCPHTSPDRSSLIEPEGAGQGDRLLDNDPRQPTHRHRRGQDVQELTLQPDQPPGRPMLLHPAAGDPTPLGSGRGMRSGWASTQAVACYQAGRRHPAGQAGGNQFGDLMAGAGRVHTAHRLADRRSELDAAHLPLDDEPGAGFDDFDRRRPRRDQRDRRAGRGSRRRRNRARRPRRPTGRAASPGQHRPWRCGWPASPPPPPLPPTARLRPSPSTA